jgi:hypothetical protein
VNLRILAIVVWCGFLQGCASYRNPWKEPEALRQTWLEITPLGSSLAEVEAKLKKRRFEVKKSLNVGFRRQEGSKSEVIGDKSIEVYLGGYRSVTLLTTTVIAIWGFDKDDKLIEIWIWKDVEGL